MGQNVSFAVDDKTEYRISCVEDLFSEGIGFDEAIDTIKTLAKDKTLVCYDFKNYAKNTALKTKNSSIL